MDWNDLDYTLNQSDILYKLQNVGHTLFVDELPNDLLIEGESITAERLSIVDGYIDANSFTNFVDRLYYSESSANGIIMFVKEFCLGLMFDQKENIFLFDSHSKNSQGMSVPNGKSILLMFSSIGNLETYLRLIYIYNGVGSYFQLVYVNVNKLTDNSRLKILRRFRKICNSYRQKKFAEKNKETFTLKRRRKYSRESYRQNKAQIS